jgi:cytochrome c biogenesis protein CcmG, thiol:disulfide interchange protein DsbE
MSRLGPRAMTRGFPWLLAAAVWSVAALGCSADSVPVEVAPHVGALAPPLDVALVGGGTLRSEDLRGAPVVVNFWATWCVPCREEMPLLDRLAEEHAGQDITVVAVNFGEPDEIPVRFPVALDPKGDVTRSYQVPVLPMTFFIDGAGVVQYRRLGELKEEHADVGLTRVLPRAGQ